MALIQVHMFSGVLGRQTTCNVIMPQKSVGQIGMDAVRNETTPVLWLLHGASDDCTIWERRTSIERYVAPLGMCVIMPEVELSSYSNMAHGGRFYDYISKELPEVMGGFFNISDKREDNYICGLSMGGAGAMKIGLANPDKYSVIGCLSAGALNHGLPQDTSALTYENNRRDYLLFDKKTIAGSEEDVFGNAQKILDSGVNIPKIYHAIGHDDFLINAAKETKDYFESLEGNPFSYKYVEDEGVHSWEFWDAHIQEFLRFINE